MENCVFFFLLFYGFRKTAHRSEQHPRGSPSSFIACSAIIITSYETTTVPHTGMTRCRYGRRPSQNLLLVDDRPSGGRSGHLFFYNAKKSVEKNRRQTGKKKKPKITTPLAAKTTRSGGRFRFRRPSASER